MNDIEKQIKKYEPMFRSLLRRFQVKKDYEDILQLLRIKTWEVLRDNKYKKVYKNKEGVIIEAKFSTFIYKVLSDRLQDILKVDYGLKIKDDKKLIEDLPIEKRIDYYLKNPIEVGIPFFPIENSATEHALRCKLDFELYYKQLSKEDKELIDLMRACDGNKKEAALKLNRTLRQVYRKLNILKKDYKKFLIKGEK